MEQRHVLPSLPDAISESMNRCNCQAGGGPESLVMFVVPSQPGSCQDLPEVKRRCQQAIHDLNPLFKLHEVGELHSMHGLLQYSILQCLSTLFWRNEEWVLERGGVLRLEFAG